MIQTTTGMTCNRGNPQVGYYSGSDTPSAHSDKGPDSLEIHGMSCALGRWYDGVASIPQSWVRPAHFRVKESRDLVSHVCSHH